MALPDAQAVIAALETAARELGFSELGVAHLDLDADIAHLDRWLALGHQGEMDWLATRRDLRAQPAQLHPGTISIISVRMDYLPESPAAAAAVLAQPEQAYISRYALGRDYHKLMRKRLSRLGEALTALVGPNGHRVFCDSAPVLEKALARNAGLGWIGKNTLLLKREAGSFFFLGELYTDARLPPGPVRAAAGDCGRCQACLKVCPTQAFTGPYQLDARRCISYLTIEHRGAIPLDLRAAIGNRIFGCDDCQLVCPWNRYARLSTLPDFAPRHGLDRVDLLALWQWTEADWLQRSEGMPLRRTGWQGWRRNLAVALGNAPFDPAILIALDSARPGADALVAEHIDWALAAQRQKGQTPTAASTARAVAANAAKPG